VGDWSSELCSCVLICYVCLNWLVWSWWYLCGCCLCVLLFVGLWLFVCVCVCARVCLCVYWIWGRNHLQTHLLPTDVLEQQNRKLSCTENLEVIFHLKYCVGWCCCSGHVSDSHVHSETFSFVMSLLGISFGDRFAWADRGGQWGRSGFTWRAK